LIIMQDSGSFEETSTDVTPFFLGVTLCVLGSWGINFAHVCLKYHRTEQSERENVGLPPKISSMYKAYWILFVLSIVLDVSSMVYLHQVVWCTISAIDVLWYNLFLYAFFDEPFEKLEIIAIFIFLAGAFFCAFWEPTDHPKTTSAWEEITTAWDGISSSEAIYFLVMFSLLVVGYIYLWAKFNQHQEQGYPSEHQPEPTSFLNCAGMMVNGISMAFFAITLYVFTNTVFVPDGTKRSSMDCVFAFCLFLPFFLISSLMDWSTATLLHYKTQIMATVMISTLVQFGANFAIWGLDFDNNITWIMWYVGIALEVTGLVGWILVQQHLKNISRETLQK